MFVFPLTLVVTLPFHMLLRLSLHFPLKFLELISCLNILVFPLASNFAFLRLPFFCQKNKQKVQGDVCFFIIFPPKILWLKFRCKILSFFYLFLRIFKTPKKIKFNSIIWLPLPPSHFFLTPDSCFWKAIFVDSFFPKKDFPFPKKHNKLSNLESGGLD